MSQHTPTTLIERRRDQMFPVLNPGQIAVARGLGGEPRRLHSTETVFELGQRGVPAYLVLSGSIEAAKRDPLGQTSAITTHGPGEVTGEISQLAGGPSLAQGRAGAQGAEAVPFDSAQLRALVVSTAAIGEIIMRAFILRRVFLIETGAGLILLGKGAAPDTLRLQNFLRRNGVPYSLLDPDEDPHAAQLIENMGITKAELPLAVCPDGSLLRRPCERTLARGLGLLPLFLADRSYDVAIVGAGPAGLATAVYAASEGLSVLVLDSRAFGGQAGASARIENYLGFPTGISGEALAGRAYTQAQKFGAVMAIPAEVKLLKSGADREDVDKLGFELDLDEGGPVHASAVVIASGARYRKLDLPNLSIFEGRGVYYWASAIEAKLCVRHEVVVVGGGNSAGQGAVYLASEAAKVHLLVRGRSLNENMSQYLVDRINALPNTNVHTETELTQLIGDEKEGLQTVCWRERSNNKEERHDIRHVFMFIGADPNTDWLRRCPVSVDEKGFIATGQSPDRLATHTGRERAGPSLETTLHGVFAVGDVRAGSVKRVSAAVGEGAAAASQLHAYLRELATDARQRSRSNT